jgi:haloalkane dehalogenase
MQLLSTPDDRFASLPDYPFAPHTVSVPRGDGSGDLQIHYVDEGAIDAEETVLMLHGEPSWSFLYRHMIPPVVGAGHRVVAPDLPGFGKSDKPTNRADYTYERHVAWMTGLLQQLDLARVTLVCQDWGGLIGLRLAAEHPDRFSRIVAANTFLPTGDRDPGDAFLGWQKFSQETPTFPVGNIVNAGCATDLSPDVITAYDAPFPDDTYKEGPRQMPALVPTSPEDPAAGANRAAWEVLATFDRPFLCCFSDRDAITKGADRRFREVVPGAAAQPHTTIEGAGHFLQEDAGAQLGAVLARFVAGG